MTLRKCSTPSFKTLLPKAYKYVRILTTDHNKSDFLQKTTRVSKKYIKFRKIMAKYWRSVANQLSTNIYKL